MTDDPQDDFPSELNSDGELSEDSLFEWDGDSWEPVEHDATPEEAPAHDVTFPASGKSREATTRTSTLREKFFAQSIVVIIVGGLILAGVISQLVRDVQRDEPADSEVPPTYIPDIEPCRAPLLSPALIFTSGDSIFAQEQDNTQTMCQMTDPQVAGYAPQLSADGERLYFLSASPQAGRLMVYDLASGELDHVGDDSALHGIDSFALSADSRQIVYVQNGHLFTFDLFRNSVSAFSADLDALQAQFPVWSPESRMIAYSSGNTIYRSAADLSGYNIIYDMGSGVQIGMIAWSPDGSRIAALASEPGASSFTSLVVVQSDGSGRQVVTQSETLTYSNPIWLADSEHIAVMEQARAATAPTVAVYNVDGSLLMRMRSRIVLPMEMTGFDLWYGSE